MLLTTYFIVSLSTSLVCIYD